VLTGGVAFAQDAATLTRFRPGATPEDDFHINRPTDLGHLRFGAQLHADYANDPLVWVPASGEESRIVAHQLDLNVGLSLGLFDRLVVFAGLPVTAVMEGDDDADLRDDGLTTPDGAGLGNAYLGARVRLLGEADEPFALAVQVVGTFPSAGRDQRFRGEDFLTLRPELLAEIRPGGNVRIVPNVGAIVRRSTETPDTNLAFSNELIFGLGIAVPIFTAADDPRTHLDLHAQIYGSTAFVEPFGRDQTALEALGGLKLFHQSGLVTGVAAGPGITEGFGSPDVRVVGMLAYVHPADLPERAPVDRDGDGILDDADQCPDEPEDVDEFEDSNGCPDPDNDSDGVLDDDDRCPLEPGPPENEGCPDTDEDGDGLVDRLDACVTEPEDTDGFEDEDGCPDPDNDGDGLLDGADRCPIEAGPPANNGCPDTDRDADSVIDRLDNCPDEAGSPENQGCPTRQLVRIEEGRLEILDVVFFATNRDVIQRRSFPLLENVARVLNAHPEIERVRVEGHTDARGRREFNLDLSQRRAEAVVRFLVDRGGVDASRLDARGFGPDNLIVPDARNRADHARNRRVEFNIVGDDSGIEQRESAPSADTVDL
jgi:outer membrane protein OmpA-like peptidoglycan-associated protein